MAAAAHQSLSSEKNMSHSDQNQTSQAETPAPMEAPPPVGYPTGAEGSKEAAQAVETKSRGDGFLKGCCAALCCCCVLDACF